MRLGTAIDLYLADMARQGRMNSPNTILAYRSKLYLLAEDVGNRDPQKIGRDDIKATLARWQHPNTQRQAHAIFNSFFDWLMEEGYRKDNPGRQVRRAKARKPSIYRMTRDEVVALMDASMEKRRDRWAVHLGVCAGLRNQEIRCLQGRHVAREGFVWVSEDIGKGRKERWVPVTPDLEPIVDEITALVPLDHYVLPGQSFLDPPHNTHRKDDPYKMLSAAALYKQIRSLGERTGIAGQIGPHSLRHAMGDHMARYAGLRAAQALLGHEDVSTTAGTYTDRVSLDELAASVRGWSYRRPVPAPVVTPERKA